MEEQETIRGYEKKPPVKRMFVPLHILYRKKKEPNASMEGGREERPTVLASAESPRSKGRNANPSHHFCREENRNTRGRSGDKKRGMGHRGKKRQARRRESRGKKPGMVF